MGPAVNWSKWKQTGSLELWVETRGRSGMEHKVPQEIVPAGPIAAPAAGERVVSVGIQDTIAAGTKVVPLRERDAEPPL